MLTLNCFLFSIAHVRNKGKTQKVSKGLSVRKIYTNMYMPEFFQPMLLNSIFMNKKTPLLVLVNIPVPTQSRTF